MISFSCGELLEEYGKVSKHDVVSTFVAPRSGHSHRLVTQWLQSDWGLNGQNLHCQEWNFQDGLSQIQEPAHIQSRFRRRAASREGGPGTGDGL